MMTLFHLWDLPGDVLAAPESASGLDRCNLSLSGRGGSKYDRGPYTVSIAEVGLCFAAVAVEREQLMTAW